MGEMMSLAIVEGIKISVYVKVSDGSQLTYEATFRYKNSEKNVVKYLKKIHRVHYL